MGFKYYEGTTRLVFLIGDLAIKVPNFKYEFSHLKKGIHANNEEYKQWSLYKDKRLCPVIFKAFKGIFIIMHRTVPLNRQQFYALSFDPWFLENKILIEFKLDSFGYFKDRVVAIDYGNI